MPQTSNYKVILEAYIDTKNIPKQAQEIGKTIKIKVDSTQVRDASKDVKDLGNHWKNTIADFSRHAVVEKAFKLIKDAIMEAVKNVYELDTALTEFNKVTVLSERQLDKFIDKAYKAGETTAKTGREMIEASTEFAKTDFSADESLKLAKYATMYQNIADEAISAGEAASFIISQIKAFDMTAKDAEKIIDAVNEVSNKYSVSSADLANNLGKVSATMATSGTSYEQTLGMLTAITEITRTAGKSANALKTISQRIRGVGEDGEDASQVTGDLQKKFDELGISIQIVNKETGEMKSTYDIMSAIAGKWEGFNDSQRQELGELAAGKNRITEFNALMLNFGVAISATETALNSAGSAEKENAVVLESMKGKLQELKSAFENFSRKTLNSELLKALIEVGTAFIKLADNDIGRTIISFIALKTAIRGFSSAFKFMLRFKEFQSFLISTTIMLGELTSGLAGASVAITAFTKTMLKSPLFLGVVAVTGINAIIKAVETANVTLEEQKDIVNNLTTEYQEIESDIKSFEDQIKSNISRIEELNALPTKSIIDDDEITNLELSNGELKTRIDLLNREKAIKLENLARETKEEFKKDFQVSNEKKSIYQKKSYETETGTLEFSADITEEEYAQEAIRKLSEYNELKQKGVLLTKEEQIEYTSIRESLNEIGIKYSDFANREGLAADDEDRLSWANLANAINDVLLKAEELPGATKNTFDPVKEETKLFSELAGKMASISEKMSILSRAQEEVSETGGITANTFRSLVENNLIQYLDVVDGKIVGVDISMKDAAKSTRDNAISHMQATLTANVLAIAEGNLIKNTDDTSTAANNALTPLDDIGKKYADVGSKALAASGNISVFNSILSGKGKSVEEFSKEQLAAVDVAMESARKGIAFYNSIYNSMSGGNSGSTKKNDKSSSSNVTDIWKSSFESALKELQYKRDKDIVSEKEYYTQLESLNKKYFKNKKKYLDEYRKYEIEVYKYLRESQKEFYDESQKDLEHSIFLIEQNTGKTESEILKSEKSQISIYKILQKNAHDEAQRLREIGIKENDDYLQELQKQWWNYSKKISEIQKNEIVKSLESEKSKIEATLSIYERYADERVNSAQKEIDRLNEEKDSLQKLNDERKDAIRLQELEDALSKAKSRQVRIYREGKGFVYEQDSIAVSEAQKDLEEYKQQELLEKEQDRIDSEIKLWDEEKKKWSEVVSNYKEQQDLLIDEQISGISLEKLNYDTRLRNLKDFVTEYNRINSELNNVNDKISNIGSGGKVGFDPNVDYQALINSATLQSEKDYYNQQRNEKIDAGYGGIYDKNKWANGTNNYHGGTLIVGKTIGEQGREIITPPKGSGIIPNPLTERLMEFGENPIMFLSNLIRRPSFERNSSGQSIVENYNISNVNVNANNANEFLSSIKALAIQRTTNRK